MAVAVWARDAAGGLAWGVCLWSVSETDSDRREAVVLAGAKRSQKTRRRREAARRGDE